MAGSRCATPKRSPVAPYELKPWIEPVGPFGLLFCSSNQAAKKAAAVWIDRDTESEIALVQMAGRALRYQAGKVARIYTRTVEARVRLGDGDVALGSSVESPKRES